METYPISILAEFGRSWPAIALSALLSLAATCANAGCSAQSGNPQLHLVELYTSEGCSSCPPADLWMDSLLQHPEMAGLEFHVDYFDTLEFRDPFGNHAYTMRQQAEAKATTQGFYATPQIWVDGQPWRDWPKPDPPKLSIANSSTLAMKIVPGQPLRAVFGLVNPTPGEADEYNLFAAVTESGLASTVSGGENKGKRFIQDGVVRAFAGPLPAKQTDVRLDLPKGLSLSHASVVGFLQSKRSNKVIDVVRVHLATCTNQ